MNDERARTLERLAQGSGDPADEAAWHLQRIRQGDLPPECAELAVRLGRGDLSRPRLLFLAYLGHPPARELLLEEVVELAAYLGDHGAARVALGDEPTDADADPWFRGLGAFGAPVALRALAALLRARWQQPITAHDHAELYPDEVWIVERERERGLDLARPVVEALIALAEGREGAGEALSEALEPVGAVELHHGYQSLLSCAWRVGQEARCWERPSSRSALWGREPSTPYEARITAPELAAVRAELVAWALGADPPDPNPDRS